MSYDTERFIMEIQKRQGIWNISCDDYANKQKKKVLWQEMCHIFYPDFEEMSDVEKCQAENVLQKKWRNLRTCFMRELNKQKSPSDNGPFPRRQYLYFNHLLFLRDIVEYRSSSLLSVIDDESTDEHAEYFSIQPSDRSSVAQCNDIAQEDTKPPERERKERRRRNKTTDNTLLKLITKSVKRKEERKGRVQEDADKLFLLSLLPEIKQIPKEHSLSAKSDILLIIQKWKNLKSNLGLTMLPNN